ncbi:MAG: glycoside hydrolase family 13 protein [Chloroflexi bacterium]|nr:glycoside hydrolase family 13 protein [Chloroflexota bacterium]
MSVPDWVQDAIFYQIFPDRFANGDPANDPFNIQPWGTPPQLRGFQGGDLEGVIQKLDYLHDLGVNAIYFNPVFQAASNHRYDTYDYFKIDPKLGDLSTFKRLLKLAHGLGIRVILDGVFNHCGRGFFAFHDVLENEAASPYLKWFHIKGFPLNAFGDEPPPNYECWWQNKSLPKFNIGEPQVRKYLLDAARYWIEQGADGWRMDVPNEIDDDDFWAEFRSVVKSINPHAYTLGEIWDVNPRWVGERSFDGLMNYPFRTAAIDFFGRNSLSVSQFSNTVEHLLTVYPREHIYAQFNPLGSHDTERTLMMCGGDLARMKLALLFQLTYVGAPSIYYGDEIGLTGGKDPDCRRAFTWDEASWNADLHGFVKSLVAIRKAHPALRRGEHRPLYHHDRDGLYAFLRKHDQHERDALIVVFNNSDGTVIRNIPATHSGWPSGAWARDLLSGKKFVVENHFVTNLRLSPRTGMILSTQ